MVTRALVLIEGTRTGTGLRYVRAAQRLGLHPITLSADPAQYDYLAAEKIETTCVDTGNLDALIHKCTQLSATYEIAGITCVSEPFYSTVGKLCGYFDLPGPNPVSIERCCDKIDQRQLLADAGVAIPAYHAAADATEVECAAAEIGLPVILKPATGSGSSGVRLCRNGEELVEHATYLLDEKNTWRSPPRLLVEEFVCGPYYSANIMGNEVIGICAGNFGRPPHFVYHEYTFPAMLTDDEYERIANVSLSCLRALGLGWGPTNVEVRWTKLGPIVIEVNPQLAGTPDPQLIHLAYGVDLINEHIKLVTGQASNLRIGQLNTAAARFLVPDRDGMLNCISGDSRAAAVPGVAEVMFYVEPKTPFVRRGDFRDCIGHVIAVSRSFAHTEAILHHAVNLIDWSITPLPTPLASKKPCGPLSSPRILNRD